MAQISTVLLVAGVLAAQSIFCASDNASLPCAYTDTVNLTGYENFLNGSYLYKGTIIPADLIAIFDSNDNSSAEQVPVQPHIRGCICKLKACVKFCCPLDQKHDGFNCEGVNENFSTLMNITTNEGDVIEEDVLAKFAVQIGKPCPGMFNLIPHLEEDNEFSLFENGTLYRWYDKKYFTKDEFCLASHPDADNKTEVLVAANCLQPVPVDYKALVYACMMLFSVPFMVLTIFVYLSVPELRTLHGKSLCCYLLGLCFGYTILGVFVIMPLDEVSQFHCAFWGFLAYFSFMASFFWLSVISFDLYNNIRGTRRSYNERNRFIQYSIYAWGLAFIFLGLTYYAQHSPSISEYWQPGIGGEQFCWLNVKYGWSALIYLYIPVIIIMAFNITMFILTARQINSVQKEMNRMMEQNDSHRNLRTEKDRFGIFLRLFIVMGVTWSMEIISYFVAEGSVWDIIFYISDFCNGVQGFVIFALFVLTRKVKQAIFKRFRKDQEISDSTSSEEMSEQL